MNDMRRFFCLTHQCQSDCFFCDCRTSILITPSRLYGRFRLLTFPQVVHRMLPCAARWIALSTPSLINPHESPSRHQCCFKLISFQNHLTSIYQVKIHFKMPEFDPGPTCGVRGLGGRGRRPRRRPPPLLPGPLGSSRRPPIEAMGGNGGIPFRGRGGPRDGGP